MSSSGVARRGGAAGRLTEVMAGEDMSVAFTGFSEQWGSYQDRRMGSSGRLQGLQIYRFWGKGGMLLEVCIPSRQSTRERSIH